jgi:hypothetical protein
MQLRSHSCVRGALSSKTTVLPVNLTAFLRGESNFCSPVGDVSVSDLDEGTANDRAPGRNLVILVFNDTRDRADLAMEGVTEVMVVVDIEAAESPGVVAGVMLDEVVGVLDFLSEDLAGGGAWTRGVTPSWDVSDGGQGFRWCFPTGLRCGVREMWRPIAICSIVGGVAAASWKRKREGV